MKLVPKGMCEHPCRTGRGDRSQVAPARTTYPLAAGGSDDVSRTRFQQLSWCSQGGGLLATRLHWSQRKTPAPAVVVRTRGPSGSCRNRRSPSAWCEPDAAEGVALRPRPPSSGRPQLAGSPWPRSPQASGRQAPASVDRRAPWGAGAAAAGGGPGPRVAHRPVGGRPGRSTRPSRLRRRVRRGHLHKPITGCLESYLRATILGKRRAIRWIIASLTNASALVVVPS